MSSQVPFLPVFLFPLGQQVRSVFEAPHHAVDILLGDWLKDNAAELILKESNLRTRLDAVLPPQFCRNHKLAF
jgi:hypothetical protein